jgi:hypothetical protein
MGLTAKSLYIASQSIERFVMRPRGCWLLTFTFKENINDKAEAEKRFRPFVDLLRRRGVQHLDVWENQTRGSWHVHMLVDRYLDVNEIRKWMVDRGWGPQMRFEKAEGRPVFVEGKGWIEDARGKEKVVRYLCKYLRKGLGFGSGKRIKLFGGDRCSRVGTTSFKWAPWENATSWLYQVGRDAWMIMHDDRSPRWRDFWRIVELGDIVTGWSKECDFLYWQTQGRLLWRM